MVMVLRVTGDVLSRRFERAPNGHTSHGPPRALAPRETAALPAPLAGRTLPITSTGPRRQTASGTADQGTLAVLAAVAEPNRLRLLRLMLDGEQCVAQCVDQTGLVQSLVSKHLGKLIDAGLVQRRRSGRRSYHSVVDPDGLHEILDAAARLAPPPRPG
jgi:DNA-binding transcriptional ArsR family regulator